MDFTQVPEGTPVLVGTKTVPMPSLAPGDTLLPVAATGELLLIPQAARQAAVEAVDDALDAFAVVSRADPAQISTFFQVFADRLADDNVWAEISEANAADVTRARAAGRLVGRLRVSDKMRTDMIEGLAAWAVSPSRVGEVIARREAKDFVIERRRAPLGPVAFIFEGRPNVFADGAGVLRNGNTAVMRIGSDAYGTARAVVEGALGPALDEAALPRGAVRLVESRERAAAQALFTLPKVRLAVARGSGATVSLLGSIAESHGIPVSLHGTGGGWVYVDRSAREETVANVIRSSLDRKVCNTLNVLVIDEEAIERLGPVAVRVLSDLGAKVHVTHGGQRMLPDGLALEEEDLSLEWEWDDIPECTLIVAKGFDDAVSLINRYSPRLVASVLTTNDAVFEDFYDKVEVPYVGNGFTRWVDGQWAWDLPELGLTNWERGRLLGRSGFLTGDDIFSVRDVFLDTSGAGVQYR